MSDTGEPLRPVIASAWRRARLCGLDPGSALSETRLVDVPRDSTLLKAARPILDRAVERLADTRFSLLLADRDARIVDRRFGHRSLSRALDGVLAVPGALYSEENTGINALASAYETRAALTVHGEEHFLDRMKDFTCYGRPIVHPVTGRLEGVLDVTGFARDAHPHLQPFVTLVVGAIEDRLALGHGVAERRMLAAFQERTARTRRPVLVFGDDLTLANVAATDQLDGSAQTILRELARQADGQAIGTAALPSGQVVRFRCEAVDGVSHAMLVEVVPDGGARRRGVPRGARARRRTWPDPAELGRLRDTRTNTMVSGEPGTGRTRWTSALAGADAPLVLDPEVLPGVGRGALRDGRLVVVEHVHLLSDPTARRLGAWLDEAGAWFALTGPAPAGLTPEQRALVARCPAQVRLEPLRARRAEIAVLGQAILDERHPGRRLRLAPDALTALMSWSWPGNLRELDAVLVAAAGRAVDGRITAEHLPIESVPGRPLTPLEQAEYDTIRSALRVHHGNKTHAAAELGIGRTTLYRRMRELGLRS